MRRRDTSRLARAGIGALLFLFLILTGGCWDRLELSDRLYGLGVGLDLVELPTAPRDIRRPSGKYRMSTELAVWEAYASGEQGGGGGLKPPKPYWLLVTTGNSVGTMTEQYSKRSYRPMSWGHLKVIVVGEKLARENMVHILDYFTRQREVRRSVKLAIAEGEARKALEVQPKVEKIAAFALVRLLTASRGTNRSIDMTLGEFVSMIDPHGGFLVPRIRPAKGEFAVAGAAVFRGEKMVGWLGERETSGASILTNRSKGGTVEFRDPATGESGSLRIRRVRTKWRPHAEDKHASFVAEIQLEGDLEECPESPLDPRKLNQIIKLVAAEVAKDAREAVAASKRLRSDFLGVGQLLAKWYPAEWERMKKGWNDQYASKTPVIIRKVQVRIHQTGQVK